MHTVPTDTLPLGPIVHHTKRQAALAQLATAYARTDPVRRVFIVGNRPMSPNDGRAEAIDSSDLVVRINNYQVDRPGTDRTYGTATHVVFFTRWTKRATHMFDTYSSRLNVLAEPEAILQGQRPPHRQWPPDFGWVHLSNSHVTLPLSAQMGIDGRSQHIWPTTGSLAAWWAIDSFPEAQVTLSGFSVMEPDVYRREWEYASGAPASTLGEEHRVDQEGLVMRRWLDRGLATYAA